MLYQSGVNIINVRSFVVFLETEYVEEVLQTCKIYQTRRAFYPFAEQVQNLHFELPRADFSLFFSASNYLPGLYKIII